MWWARRAGGAALQGGLNVKVARLPVGLDPADLIQKEGKDAWSSAIRESKDIITFLLDVLEGSAKGKDNFRRSVESVVLPFLSDVASPIARESYVREIASRLGVSEGAVGEALAKVPTVPQEASTQNVPAAALEKKNFDRVQQAFSILLWQESLKKSTVDLDAYKKEFTEAIGEEALAVLRELPDGEKEQMRFRAESMNAGRTTPPREIEALLPVLLRERLSAELAIATTALKEAETRGDDKDVGVHISVVKLLTTRIAQLHASV